MSAMTAPMLGRTTFPTSRLRDFSSRKELITAADVAFLEGDLLVDLIDTKVTTMGITKVAPGPDMLACAYRRACQIEILNRALAAAADGARRQAAVIDLPYDLVVRVRAHLEEHPEEPWDAAIARLADDVLPGAGSDHGPSRDLRNEGPDAGEAERQREPDGNPSSPEA